MAFKRALVRLQKGVSKRLKGHLLQARRASLRSQMSIFRFLRPEFSLQRRMVNENGKERKKGEKVKW
ncbi:hypothetical protein HMPREF9148_01795 [Prevotella sp. F0091]|nr:hypothetical protein HMPREF9148_01795 [Prevotella sp. F0091]